MMSFLFDIGDFSVGVLTSLPTYDEDFYKLCISTSETFLVFTDFSINADCFNEGLDVCKILR